MLMLVFAVARTNYGIWNSDIPLGDESGPVEQAFNLFQLGRFSSNIYVDSYILCYKFITQDPIVAHYIVRFAASLTSVIGLFLLLSALNWVSPFGSFVLALLWNLNLLVTPVVQSGNPSLFAFALACIAGYLWISDFGRLAKLLSLVVLLAAISVRIEYVLVLAFLAVRYSALWLLRLKRDGWSRESLFRFFIPAGIIAVPMVAVIASAHFREYTSNIFRYLDGYLFLGLEQCYTAFWVIRNPGLGLEPMTEFGPVISRSFPGATGFFQAAVINPVEMSRYFFLNGSFNFSHLYWLLPSHSIILPTWQGLAKAKQLPGYYLLWVEQLTIYLGIAAGGIWLFKNKILKLGLSGFWRNDGLFFVFSLATVPMTSILLHMPTPRYWIAFIPLIFWGPSALVSLYGSRCGNNTKICLSILLSLALVNPVFTSSLNIAPPKDKDLVLALREKLSPVTKTPIKALGAFPDPLLSFTIPGRWQSTGNTEVRKDSSYEALVMLKVNDLVIVDTWLSTTQQYKKEQEFFGRFLRHPQAYGYERLLATENNEGPVYIFKRSDART